MSKNIPQLLAQAADRTVRRDLLEIQRWAASLGLETDATVPELIEGAVEGLADTGVDSVPVDDTEEEVAVVETETVGQDEVEDLRRMLRLLLKAWILVGLPAPPGLEREYQIALETN